MDDVLEKLLDAVEKAYRGMGSSPAQFPAEEALEDIHFHALHDPASVEGQWDQ